MKISLLLNFINTVIHLKPRQIRHQLTVRFFRKPLSLTTSPDIELQHFTQIKAFIPRWTGGEFNLVKKTFEFLNLKKEYADTVNWNDISYGGLWLDHLHYFRYLDTLEATRENSRKVYGLIMDWRSNRENCEKAFYPPYNASERAFCMGRWLLLNHHNLSRPEGCHIAKVIAQDIEYICDNLEWHLDGNHLLKNIAAIWWGTKLFSGNTTKKWQSILDQHLSEIMATQILPDGMHYEKSAVYHQITLIDFVDILALMAQNDPQYDFLRNIVLKMVSALSILAHPDGKVCMFNDSPSNMSSNTLSVLNYCTELLGPVNAINTLENAGYYQLTAGDYFLVADFGNMGPDEQMGHAHSDMLHFEMSYHGKRILVEGGTSSYYNAERRIYERSTAAHNTIAINHKSQSENWSSFRVAQRGHCHFLSHDRQNGTQTIIAEHDGYFRKYGIIHRREISCQANKIIVSDTLLSTNSSSQAIVGYLHLSDLCTVERISDQVVSLNIPSEKTLYIHFENAAIEIEQMEYSENYNELKIGTRLIIKVDKNRLQTRFYIQTTAPEK